VTKKQRLELTWIGKENRPKLEPRILLENPAKSYHAEHKVTEKDIFGNRLIFGDNLLALKALEAEFAGKVKCAAIDPPYNTGSAFTHYDDGLEHSIWLSLMRDRLRVLRQLLTDDGSLWIFIDDHEAHYLKILLDEVFGRNNFITNIIWEKNTSLRNDAQYFSSSHDHLLVFAKNKTLFKANGLTRTEASESAYSNPDNDPRGPWREGDYKCAKTAEERPNLYYPIIHPYTNEEVWPRKSRVWAYGFETYQKHVQENKLWWGKTGKYKFPKLKRFKSDAPQKIVPQTLWLAKDVGQTRTAKNEAKELNPDNPFPTPKPEKVLERLLTIATNAGDIVLDSFAGSGTTGAVAHKMGRRWIMIELGEHCHTHIIPRLKKVIDGEDEGGITEAVNWQGGGGFRYYHLAPSLLKQDRWGRWVINKAYNAEMLAEALCKLEGFTYAPSDTFYWQHGYSTERDFIYVTTQNLSYEQLAQLSEEVGTDRTLLVLSAAFRGKPDFPNLTVKKIPNHVLKRCEWDHDDYSLRVENLPKAPPPSQTKSSQLEIDQMELEL
jgi:adenine-specific DNA-methyltransferase